VQLLDGLLLLTRAQDGALPLERTVTDVSALVAHSIDSLAVLAEEKRQVLVCATAPGVLATVDEATLKQAVYNLLANAIRYTPAGGAIEARVASRPGEVVVEVADTGPGIAPEHQAHVFERFYRVEPDRSRATGGTGLGLAIAQWAVQANGGVIELESAPKHGSTFRIRLPVA
jgi:signal transduction histidine kinase